MKTFKVGVQEKGKKKFYLVKESELENFSKSHTIVELKTFSTVKRSFFNKRISKKEVALFFNQLATMLHANIPFLEALEIISLSTKSHALTLLLNDLKETLYSGQPIEEALLKHQDSLDITIIGFLKIAFLKGNLTSMIVSLSQLLTLKEQNRVRIKSALSYPLVVVFTFLIALSIIFIYVIPKFEFVFMQYNLQLPFYTSSLLYVKTFLVKYVFFLIGFFCLLLYCFHYFYKHNDSFTYRVDKFLLLKVPFFSSIYKTSQLYNFFIALNVLQSASYQFSEALENAQLLLKNKYLLDKIRIISKQIQSGMPIYNAFDSSQLFDEVTLNLINSGEKSSTLIFCFEKIEIIYEENFKKNIKRFSSFIEPLFFVLMMILVLWVMLAIFTPIWNMSGMINQ